MTDLREINTLEDAIHDAINRIGVGRISKGVGLAAHIISRWSRHEPNNGAPNWVQMLAIDAACEARGKGRPITEFFQSCSIGCDKAKPLGKSMMLLGKACGDVMSVVAEALDPQGPGGDQVTPEEYKQGRNEIKRARKTLAEAEAAFDARASGKAPL